MMVHPFSAAVKDFTNQKAMARQLPVPLNDNRITVYFYTNKSAFLLKNEENRIHAFS